MAVQPPIKTTSADLDAVLGYLRNEVGWVPLEQVRRTIPSAHADNRKVEALKYLGLIDRDQANVKMTDGGRRYIEASDAEDQAAAIRDLLADVQLYDNTLKWLHNSKKSSPTKIDLANYWHDKQADLLGGASGAALTDAAIFFMRAVDLAGLGKFVSAGTGRPTHLKVDEEALTNYVTGFAKPTQSSSTPAPSTSPLATTTPSAGTTVPTLTPSVSGQVHVTIEIHIAADAKAATVESVFKNMRKYVLGHNDDSDAATT
jgi:hypothetical protein